ncbi:MAG: polyprenyl synthetase family protein [Planctomycetia bacterium]|nr:polyprenyl synthetase family protein [Planctomycetia bacterium]
MTEEQRVTEQKWNELFEACNSLQIFKQWMKLIPPVVDKALKEYCELTRNVPERLRGAMEYSLLAPGKRFRPMLTFLAAMICNQKYTQKEMFHRVTPAACAVEIIHAYSLIHDDLPAMDDDELRRGRPTCHIQYDEATAILAADALQSLAFEVLSRVPDVSKVGYFVRFLAIAAGQAGMVGGQMDDIFPDKDEVYRVCLLKMFCGGNYELFCKVFSMEETDTASAVEYICRLRTQQERGNTASPRTELEKKILYLESMQNRKTGALISVSLLLGALAVDATAEQAMRLVRFGQHLGLAFQVTDDMLDVSGTVEEMGKNVQKDKDAGKLTWPGLLGMERCRVLVEEITQNAKEEVSSSCFLGRERVLESLLEYLKTRRS